MAESVARIGYGGTLEYSTDGGTNYTSITEYKSGSLPTNTVAKADRTHMSSPDRTREYTPGLKEPNDISFTANYNPTDYENLLTLQQASTVALWRQTTSPQDGQTTGAEFTYLGFVGGIEVSLAVDDVSEMSVTIMRTGMFTHTPGA